MLEINSTFYFLIGSFINIVLVFLDSFLNQYMKGKIQTSTLPFLYKLYMKVIENVHQSKGKFISRNISANNRKIMEFGHQHFVNEHHTI